MREFKFRGWWADDKTSVGNVLKLDYMIETDEIILEQFTGLLDKNGTEIYEGDILKYHTENFYGEVEFCYGAFSTTARGFGMEYLHIAHDECIIVGNIHENAELVV